MAVLFVISLLIFFWPDKISFPVSFQQTIQKRTSLSVNWKVPLGKTWQVLTLSYQDRKVNSMCASGAAEYETAVNHLGQQ